MFASCCSPSLANVSPIPAPCPPAAQGLEAFFDCEALLCQLVEAGQEGLAQSWAAVLGPELKVGVCVYVCVHACLDSLEHASMSLRVVVHSC